MIIGLVNSIISVRLLRYQAVGLPLQYDNRFNYATRQPLNSRYVIVLLLLSDFNAL